MGASASGARNAYAFKASMGRGGQLPGQDTITYQGVFNEHLWPVGPADEREVLSTETMAAYDRDGCPWAAIFIKAWGRHTAQSAVHNAPGYYVFPWLLPLLTWRPRPPAPHTHTSPRRRTGTPERSPPQAERTRTHARTHAEREWRDRGEGAREGGREARVRGSEQGREARARRQRPVQGSPEDGQTGVMFCGQEGERGTAKTVPKRGAGE